MTSEDIQKIIVRSAPAVQDTGALLYVAVLEVAYQLAVANELREMGRCDNVSKPHQINRHAKFDCDSRVECKNWHAYKEYER